MAETNNKDVTEELEKDKVVEETVDTEENKAAGGECRGNKNRGFCRERKCTGYRSSFGRDRYKRKERWHLWQKEEKR